MNDHEEALLREFVRVTLLKEDDTGGAGYGGPGSVGGMGGYGMSNYGTSLKSIFIDPFVDAGKMIKASGTKAILRVKTLVKVAIETILTTMIPFLQSNYTAIFKNEREELKKLRERYKDAYAAVDKAFSNDVMLLAFMVNPETFIGVKFAQKSPELAMSVLETLAIGNEQLVKYFADVRKRLQHINKELGDDISNYKVDARGQFVSAAARGPYMTKRKRDLLSKAGIGEAATPSSDPATQNAMIVQQVLRDPNVLRQLQSSPRVQELKATAQSLAGSLSSKVLAEATRVLAVRTLEDLQRVSGQQVNVAGLDQLQGPEKASAEEAIVAQVRAAMKQFYVTSLKSEVEGLIRDGVDPNNLYIRTLEGSLEKLASM